VSRPPAARVVGLLLLAAASACEGDGFSAPLVLGGREVPAKVLSRGRLEYQRYCVGCHGLRGDGQGPSAASMNPAPRDFTIGRFKFAGVLSGALPSDEDLLRTLRQGLRGTHMPGYGAISDEAATALVQYLKTFSPRWLHERPGKPVPLRPDPWPRGEGPQGGARARGEVVYHAIAQCWTCHPSYVARETVRAWIEEEARRRGVEHPTRPFRSEMTRSHAVLSEYGKLLPPDFVGDTLRASHDDSEIYRTVAAGIGGTPMPAWIAELSPRDLWAVVHYVRDLIRIKGTPDGEALRRRTDR